MCIYICIYVRKGLVTLTCMSEHVAPGSKMSDSVIQLDAGCVSLNFPGCASRQCNG